MKNKIPEKAKWNIERLFWILISFVMIIMGVFIKSLEFLTYIGIFLWGNILGSLK
jgi:hypothetical protein